MELYLKTKKYKKLMAFGLAVAVAFSSGSSIVTQAGIVEEQTENSFSDSYERIMNEYYHAQSQTDFDLRSANNTLEVERDQALRDAGYMVYEVNSTNIDFVENELCTDLSSIGLDNGENYLVVVGSDVQSRTAEGEYSYNYGGTTYTMRKMWVTAANGGSGYSQASEVNVLRSSSEDLIKNVLNTAVYAYINSYSQTLGTIASICGLNFGDFGSRQSSTLNLNAGSNWSRLYTQVYSAYDDAWRYGSCVEYVYCYTYMSGTYYNAKLNQMQKVPENENDMTYYSAKYNDQTWQNNQAAIAYNYMNPCKYDLTGDVQYKYNNEVKITHRENF